MKRTFQFLALVAICSAMMVSCKNKQSEPTPEDIQAKKVALADSILAQIDVLAEQYFIATDGSFNFAVFELTEQEKLVKPDYLIETSQLNNLVTKEQKANALGILIIDIIVKSLYDMPKDEYSEAITKLALELNHPYDDRMKSKDELPSAKWRRLYNTCKENGDVAYFWQSTYAMITEMTYILAQNPELFFSKITEDQMLEFQIRWGTVIGAMRELAQYDETISDLYNKYQSTRVSKSTEDAKVIYGDIESTKQTYLTTRDKQIARRNALLQ